MEQLFLDDIMDVTNYVLEENGPYARKVKKGNTVLWLHVDFSLFYTGISVL